MLLGLSLGLAGEVTVGFLESESRFKQEEGQLSQHNKLTQYFKIEDGLRVVF